MRESAIEQYLVKRVGELGGEVRKVQWGGRRGAPDRVVMLPIEPCDHARRSCKDIGCAGPWRPVIWVELKAPGEKCRPHQIREHERMRRMGQRVEVVDSIDGVDEVLL